MPRLLVLRPGAVGGTLLTAPALVALADGFPGHEILRAGNAAALPVLAAAGLVDCSWPFDGPAVTALFMAREPSPDDPFLDLAAAGAWGADSDGKMSRSLRARGPKRLAIVPSTPPAG